jgi:hypothetical protein
MLGRATAQAVSSWLPTAAAQVWSSGICGGQSGAGAGFLQVLQFPLSSFIPPNSPSSQSLGAGTIVQKWLTFQVDPDWTPPPTMWIKKTNRRRWEKSLKNYSVTGFNDILEVLTAIKMTVFMMWPTSYIFRREDSPTKNLESKLLWEG